MTPRFSSVTAWVLVLAVALVAGLTAGDVSAQGTVTLRMVYPGWDSKAQEEAVTSLIAEFERRNPGIRVELINIPWPVLHERLVVMLRSGDPPDLGYIIVRWLQEFQAAGFLADITERVATLDRPDWIESTWVPATVDGRIYAVADRVDPYMIYYNQDLFDRLGIDSFPETLDEFVAVGQKLTGGGRYAFGLVGAKHATLIGQYMNFLYAFHGDFFTPDGRQAVVNSEAGVEALTFYTDLVKRYQIAQPSAAGDSRDEVRQLFMTGLVAMMIDGPWATGTFRDMAPHLNWSVGKIPAAPGRERRSVLSAWYYTIFAGSRHKEEAWKLISFLLEPENMAKGVVTLPARRTAAQSPRFATPEWEPWVEALEWADPEPSTPYFNDIADIMADAVQEVLLGRKTPQRAADDAAARIQRLLR